jgi:hypothetical protein
VLPRVVSFPPHDVTVAGKSMTELADARRTPCVLITPRASGTRDQFVSVVIATITGRAEPDRARRAVQLTVDCSLEAFPDTIAFAVLLNGPRDGMMVPSELVTRGRFGRRVRALLPAIASPGDRVVLFCDATIAHAQLIPPATALTDTHDEVDEWTGRCQK